MFSFFTFLFLSLLVSASAVPLVYVPLQERDVVAPPVTAPNSTSVWTVGSTQIVVWDTSGLPPYQNITNRVGQVLLGHLGGGGLNLMLNNPLAQGFNITQGSVSVVVPNVPSRTDYLVVLMGDSGNASPTFTILSDSVGTVTPYRTPQTSPSSTGMSTSSTGGAQSSTPGSTPMATAQSASTLAVTNTFTTSGAPSSTTVVTQPSSTGTSTTTSGALSMRPIGATCLSVALIISGILL